MSLDNIEFPFSITTYKLILLVTKVTSYKQDRLVYEFYVSFLERIVKNTVAVNGEQVGTELICVPGLVVQG